MGYFTVDTKVIKNVIAEMKTKENYFLNKKDTFNASNFNSVGKITNKLTQVQKIYTSIASNINTLEKYIQEYVDDIESFENIMARHQGYVKAEGIYEEINKYKNLINNKYPYKNYLFDMNVMASTTAGLENQYKFGIHTQEEAKAIMDYFTDATAYYTMAGFTSEDIKRLLREEITPEDLILEIQRDPDRTRMEKLTEATYLANYTQGFKSMEELDEAIANLESQVEALSDSTNEEDIKNLEYFQNLLEGCLEIKKLGVIGVTNLEDLDAKMASFREQLAKLLNNSIVFNYYECKNINMVIEGMMGSTSHSFDDFKNQYVAVKCTDKNGTEYYIYPENVYEYQSTEDVTYEYVTFEEMYSGTELYEELISVLSDEEGYSIFTNENVTTKVWNPTTKANNFYQKITSMNTGYSRTYNDFIAKNGAQIAQLQTNLDNYAFVKQSVLNDTIYYMNYIDVAAKNADFDENCVFNEDCLKGIDGLFATISSPTIATNVNDIARNSSNPSITFINDTEQIVDIISCFINGKISIDATGYVIYNDKFAKFDDREELITHYAEWVEVITDDEKKAFNYILNTEGYEKAYEYLKSISTELDKRWYMNEVQKDTEWAQKNWLNSTAASIGSVIYTPIEGIDSFFESIVAKSRGNELYQTDVYSRGLTWRDAVASKISSVGGKYGETLAFLYSTAMSMADSGLLIAANTITGGSMSAVLSLTLCGSRSYVSTINEALSRGVSTDKAILLAISSTAVETAMENYSLGHLTHLDAKLSNIASSLPSKLANALGNLPCAEILTKASYLLGSAISQGICEGEEEFTTEIVNYLLDYFILQDDSKFITSLEQNGLEKTLQDLGQDAALAALGGFLSGSVFGGIHGITTVTKTGFAFANNMYGLLEGDTRAQQFADALRINQEQEQLYQSAIDKKENNGNLTEDEINILQNGTINMQAGAQIKQNIISAFASKTQKLNDLFKEFVQDLFDEVVLTISPKTTNYKYASLENVSYTRDSNGFYASSNSLSSATEFVPLNNLLNILNNNDAYNNFLNMNSKDRMTYANAVYELLNTYQKGEISLTSKERSIANSIVSKYSSLYNIVNTMKSDVYVTHIANNGGHFSASVIFSDEFMQMYYLTKSGALNSVINVPGNEVLLKFRNNVDRFVSTIATYVINNNIELPYHCYNNFVNYLLNDRIDFNKANYLVAMDALGYTRFVTENSDSITKIISSYKYFTNQMIPLFEKFFGRYVNNKQLHKKLDNTLIYLKDSIYKKKYPKHSVGCNDGTYSKINISYKNIDSVITHESIHQISNDNAFHNINWKLKTFIKYFTNIDINASKAEFAGFKLYLYDSKGNGLGDLFTGFNETVTEFFTKQISPSSKSNYDMAVNELDILVQSGIFSMDLLQKSYLNNDILAVAKNFREILNLNDDSLFYELMSAFDKTALAENYIDQQKALTQLRQLTTKINYIYANVLENNLEKTYGNETISSKSDIFSEIETEQLIKVSSLINILTNPSAYHNFMNMDKSEKAIYANAIRQLLNSSQANGYDLKLSDEALAIASNIISNYSIQNIAVIPDNDLSATADMIPISEILNILTDEESYQKFLQMDSNKQKLYIKAISQFLDASEDYEFGLSQENIEFGRQIIQQNENTNNETIRPLTDEEIQLKMDEYNKLLESNEDLKIIIENEEKGYTVKINDDVLEDYKKLKKLQHEIETGRGTITEEELNTLQNQSIIFASEDISLDDFKKFTETEQIKYLENASIRQINDILSIKDLSDNVQNYITDKILKNEYSVFYSQALLIKYNNIYDFIINQKDVIFTLSNDSIISLISEYRFSQPDKCTPLFNELYRRIDAGDLVFDRNYNTINLYQRKINDSDIFNKLSKEYIDKIKDNLINKINNLSPDLREMIYNCDTIFDQLIFLKALENGTLDNDGLELLKTLYSTNKKIMARTNFYLLNKEYINDFGKDYLVSIITNQNLSNKIKILHDKNYNLYKNIVNAFKHYSIDNSLYTLNAKMNILVDFAFDNQAILKNANSNIFTSDEFINYILFTSNNEKVSLNKFTLDFMTNIDQMCDEKFKEFLSKYEFKHDIYLDDLKNIFYNKYFLSNNRDIQSFIKKYSTSLDAIRKYDSEAADFVEFLIKVDSIDNRADLTKLYNSLDIKISPEELLNLDNRLRSAYAKTYVEALGKTNDFIKNNSSSIIVDGKEINIVNIEDSFSLIVRSSDSGLVSDNKELINSSYIDSWNQTDTASNHILAASYITEKNIGSCPVNNEGVLYGFTNIDESKIMMMGPQDINSNINAFGYSSGAQQQFIAADEMSSYTTRIYNEIDLEKNGTIPDCVIIYSDMSEKLKSNAYKAAAEWNIPVVVIDKVKLATNQANKINNLMSEFKNTNDISYLEEALDLFESNSSGYKLNSYVDDSIREDRTSGINNQTIYDLGLFDSVTIENDIMDYIDKLTNNPHNQKSVDELIKVLEGIKAKYDLTNISINLLAKTKSNIDLDSLIALLNEIRKE